MGYVSADGIHWKKLRPEDADFRRRVRLAKRRLLVGKRKLLRMLFSQRGIAVRTISRATSRDFLTWTKAAAMDFGGHLDEQIYTNQTQPYFRATHIYLTFSMRFFHGRSGLSDAMFRANSPECVPKVRAIRSRGMQRRRFHDQSRWQPL